MSEVNNEITQANVERAESTPEFQNRTEAEGKYDPLTPELFEPFRDSTQLIEQIYLSHPLEEFSLRLRALDTPQGIQYSAALKNKGTQVKGRLKRFEIPVEDLSPVVYDFYASQVQFPKIYQHRAEPFPGVAVDFIDGRELPMIEVESIHNGEFLDTFGDHLINRSHDKEMQKEWIAHQMAGPEAIRPSFETNESFVDRVMRDMIAHYTTGNNHVVVGFSGMSGSGKSTMTRLLQQKLRETFGEEYEPLVISTDDYHFGKKWLEQTYGIGYEDWDAPRTYNTAALAHDLHRLARGEAIPGGHFDFASEEVVFDHMIEPRPFVIIEGLYAGSPDLASVRTLHYEIPTGIATSIGRDIRRLVIDQRANRVFPSPEARLRYQLETALPLYLSQERPRHNSFSASARPLAERAFLLARLDELTTRSL